MLPTLLFGPLNALLCWRSGCPAASALRGDAGAYRDCTSISEPCLQLTSRKIDLDQNTSKLVNFSSQF
jgi:hypothetical protein